MLHCITYEYAEPSVVTQRLTLKLAAEFFFELGKDFYST